ncbi:YgfZ/GcvT domain-containing protein [Oceanobacter mangrovi]|uniref:CAF17-like 4Fe-4S cluster assembly/insertion protein YgfZ n=1 Tax=Oceanobacter mangrovi TaxID=2862510 RepID=UPI001C8E4535|nr:hypothetical protein [Oceanobacter mangrovi]
MTIPATQEAFGLLVIKGPDASKLLQGQFTCNVNSMTNEQWQLGACCTAKGRMVSNFVIARHDDCFYLRLSQSVLPILQKHLAKYAVFYKVNIEASSSPVCLIARPALSGTEQAFEWKEQSATLYWPDGLAEYWAFDGQLPAEPQLSADDWQQADIKAGRVWVCEATSEHWIPQHVGWDKAGGVSFNKGCYTGQEVVARVQYLGKAKKQLVLLSSAAAPASAPELLAAVTSPTTAKAVGELASWNGQTGLAVFNNAPEETSAAFSVAEQAFEVAVEALEETAEAAAETEA